MADIENVINAALTGESWAIKELAQHLENARPDRVQAFARAQSDDRFQFLEATKDFYREYADAIAGRPDHEQLAKNFDTELARTHPQLTYRQRLKLVGNALRTFIDENEGGDEHRRASVIEQMRQNRRAGVDGNDKTTEGDSSYIVNNPDAVDAEHDSEVSETIREMARERESRREQLARKFVEDEE